jgi:hypothetical protein
MPKTPKIVDREGAKSSDSPDKMDAKRGTTKAFPRSIGGAKGG